MFERESHTHIHTVTRQVRGTHTCTHRDREKNTYLTGDGYFRTVFIANGAATAIVVGEDNGDGGLGDTRLALLVHQFLEIGDAHLLQVGDAHDEANAVQDVGLTGAIVARDGVEARVEAAHRRPRRVRLEAFQTYLLYVHPKPSSQTQVHQKQKNKQYKTATQTATTMHPPPESRSQRDNNNPLAITTTRRTAINPSTHNIPGRVFPNGGREEGRVQTEARRVEEDIPPPSVAIFHPGMTEYDLQIPRC